MEEDVQKMSEKALGMLKHMRRQIFGQPAPYVEVRGAAVSVGLALAMGYEWRYPSYFLIILY